MTSYCINRCAKPYLSYFGTFRTAKRDTRGDNLTKLLFLALFFWRIKKRVLYLHTPKEQMVGIAQSVRASDCGSEGRGFETHCPPRRGCLFQGDPFFLHHCQKLM